MSYLPCVEVEPATEARSSVIWLHGLGANGHDFESMATELKLPNALATRFIFPHSPSIPVTVNCGKVMPAWYDILEMSFERKINLEHLNSSSDAVHALIDREVERGVTPNRIVLAGFSQGGAVAYQAAFNL
ncbi:alpha/beta hydrolase [Psychromonas sp. KJ10-10]|uniref:alpha/beta hydrolase n=1 Tax=Psychromonas sp. KJ10-10 TaxID=3391823 RepID=UPI0039B3B196